jgi:hypothetical protein
MDVQSPSMGRRYPARDIADLQRPIAVQPTFVTLEVNLWVSFMRLAPWNNPLVGTAFLLRARRGNLLLNTSLYIIMLVMGMVAWQYYVSLQTNPRFQPNKVFLLMLFGGQAFLSGIIMLAQAGSALKNEVLNKTLDFQRIAAVSPWDILLGKLLGIPVMAYLLAIAAIPVAVFTLMNGVRGVDLVTLLLSWVQLLTFLFLVGSCAIQNTLQISTPKGTGASPGFGVFMGLTSVILYSSFGPGDSATFLSDPRRVAPNALLTPLTAFAGISAENPWAAQFTWFGLSIPCLLFTPIAHLVISWIVLTIMARRLGNSDSSPLGKRMGYLFLFLADTIIAGVLGSCGRFGTLGAAGFSVEQQIALFLLLHVLVSVVYFVTLTPRIDMVQSWLWRFRNPGRFVTESLLHDRAPNTLAILVNLIIAALGVLSLYLYDSGNPLSTLYVLDLPLTVAVTVIFLGLIYQATHLMSRKYGTAYYLLTLMLLMAVPTLAGVMLTSGKGEPYFSIGKVILHCSPITQALRATITQGNQPFVDVEPYYLVVGYLALSLLTWLYTARWLTRQQQRVEMTKARLLAPPATFLAVAPT